MATGWWAEIHRAVSVPVMTVAAGMAVPGVASGASVAVPVATASAGMPTPSVAVHADVAVPTATASAGMVAPDVVAGFVVSPPAMAATADMPTPGLVFSTTIDIPVATATASMPTPSVSVGLDVQITPPVMTVTADAAAPTVSSDAQITPPAMTATAAAAVPTVSSGVTVSPPVATASAGMATPTVDVPVGVHYSDNFNRANNSTLGASWTSYNLGFGELRILSNTAAVPASGAAVLSEYGSALTTDNHKASVKVAATKPDAVTLILRSDGTDMVLAGLADGSAWTISTITGNSSPYSFSGTNTERAVSGSTQTLSASDVLSFEASGAVYTVKKNGSTILTWNDSGGAHSSYVNSGHRKTAVIVEGYSSGSQAVDDFAADDL